MLHKIQFHPTLLNHMRVLLGEHILAVWMRRKIYKEMAKVMFNISIWSFQCNLTYRPKSLQSGHYSFNSDDTNHILLHCNSSSSSSSSSSSCSIIPYTVILVITRETVPKQISDGGGKHNQSYYTPFCCHKGLTLYNILSIPPWGILEVSSDMRLKWVC